MFRHLSRLAALAWLGLCLSPAPAQDFRDTFKKPETAPEFWAAMQYEIEVGNYELAAGYLKNFLEKNPTDQELLDIESKQGLTAFLQLQTIPALRKESAPLMERVSQVLQKHLADPARIKKFIAKLEASPEERAYAIDQLRRSRGLAVPFLVEALRETKDPAAHASILSALRRLGNETIPAVLAALDVDDANVRAELVTLLKDRGSREAVPYLWHLAASPRQPEHVRRAARETLAFLSGKDYELLPQAKIALTDEANRYYRHQIKFADPAKVVVWQMQPGGKDFVLPPPVLTASQAEEYYGLRFAKQALDLDPAYEPAQIVFLSLAIDKAYERAGLDQPIEKGSPRIKDLLRSVNPDLISAVLDHALNEHRVPVALGAIQTLGDIAEVRAAQQRDDRVPVLVRALHYPDRRVQLAAANALLSLPGQVPSAAHARIVEILRRNVTSDNVPKALIADANLDHANQLAQAAKQAGFEAVLVQTGRELLHRLREHTDFDWVIVDQDIADPPLAHLLAQLRADADHGSVPVLIAASPGRAGTVVGRDQALKRLTAAYKNVAVLPVADAAALKQALGDRIVRTTGKPLTDEERKANARTAMLWLRRMAVGELPGYEIEPARAAILQGLRSKELNTFAVEAAGAMNDRDSQRELAGVVLNPGMAPELRSQAAVELNRHIQHNGVLLTRDQAQNLETLFDASDDAKLRGNLARVIGSLRPNAASTSRRLQGYTPPPVAAPEPDKEKKEPVPEKEKDKEK